MTLSTFAYPHYSDAYRGEGYWRFSRTRPVQSAASGRARHMGGQRTLRSLPAR